MYFLPSIPTCIDHSFDPDNPDQVALLMFGDESGGLTIVHFLQPLNSLFAKVRTHGYISPNIDT